MNIELIFATGNANKVSEIRNVLPAGITIKSLADIGFHDDIPETSDTIEGNSLLKAHYLKEKLGHNGFAEDTGLEVEALDGEPGIYSARFAGPTKDANANMDLVLKRLEGKMNRRARFRTVITLILDDEVQQFEGILEGNIGHSKRGDHGFGYDPIFVLENGKTLAELTAGEKATLSHRAIAFHKFMEFLQNSYI